MAAIVDIEGRQDPGPVAGQIGGGDGAPGGLQLPRQAPGDLALIEVAGAGTRQATEGPGQGGNER